MPAGFDAGRPPGGGREYGIEAAWGEGIKINRYEVVFSGDIAPGVTPQDARNSLENDMLFGKTGAASLTFDGSHVVLYHSSSKQLASEASKRLQRAGLICRVRRNALDLPMQSQANTSRMLDYAIIVFFITFAILLFNHFID